MKIILWDWWPNSIQSANTLYQHGDEFEGDMNRVIEIVGKLFKGGINVMVKHTSTGVLIYGDTGGFSQR